MTPRRVSSVSSLLLSFAVLSMLPRSITKGQLPCEVEEKIDVSLVSVTAPARVITILELEGSLEECYRKCCERSESDEDYCTAVSSYLNDNFRICVLLHCVPFANCAWKESANFLAARISRGTRQSSGTTVGSAANEAVDATSTTTPAAATTTANATTALEVATTAMERAGNISLALNSPEVISRANTAANLVEWNLIGITRVDSSNSTSTRTTTTTTTTNEESNMTSLSSHSPSTDDVLAWLERTSPDDSYNNSNNNSNIINSGTGTITTTSTSTSTATTTNNSSSKSNIINRGTTSTSTTTTNNNNGDNILDALPVFPRPNEDATADTIQPEPAFLPDESDGLVQEPAVLPDETYEYDPAKEQKTPPPPPPPQQSTESEKGPEDRPTIWSRDDLSLFESGLSTADKFYVVVAIFAIAATLMAVSLVMFKRLRRARSRSYRRLRDFDATTEENASSSALLQREF